MLVKIPIDLYLYRFNCLLSIPGFFEKINFYILWFREQALGFDFKSYFLSLGLIYRIYFINIRTSVGV